MSATTDLHTPRTADSVALLVGMAVEEGLSTADVLAGSGITAAALRDPLTEIEGLQELQVIRNLLALGVDPAFAFRAGMRYRISRFGLLGYALMHSDTVRDVMALCSRFAPLSYSFCNIDVEERDLDVIVTLHCDLAPPALAAFVVERDMGALATISRDLTGRRLPLRRWWLQHAQQATLAGYEGLVKGSPEFGRPANLWMFDRSILDNRLPLANPSTRHQCVEACEALLARRQSLSRIDGRIRDRLLRSPGRMPSLEEMADVFHLTPRTLRRRLVESGTTYRDLVEDVRQTLAVTMLQDRRNSLQDIAAQLGYQDASSFTTAFRRWTGLTPSAYRRQPDRNAPPA